jgi:hypothetical protein
MKINNFGGNSVKQFQLGKKGKEMLGFGPYQYFIYESQEDEKIKFGDLRSFTIYILEKSKKSSVIAETLKEKLEQGDAIQAEDCDVNITVKNGSVKFLVSGTANPHPDIKGLFFTRAKNIYKVIKPWGHELWINGKHPCYAFKQVFVLAGTKTSLQYHNFKQETNVLLNGIAILHYKNNNISNDLVTPVDTKCVKIYPVSSIDVMPLTLHRLEAVSDVTLYETSTPHLDDVIRVLDDNKRADGYINNEHIY